MSRPRIRTLKPEIWEDQAVGKLGPWERLLFIGLITMADDDGRLLALPTAIAGRVFPWDASAAGKVAGWLRRVAQVDLVLLYQCEGIDYIQIRSWSSHQKINRKVDSRLPAPSVNGAAHAH
jgi:hypothetical protein